jgi:tripartite-type tricarboxylate transporter receptor subunit TctC
MTFSLAMLRQAHRIAAAFACATMWLAATNPAPAQGWPNRTILAISPLGAGNAADVVARVVLDQLSQQLGQSIVVENRTGAGGTIGVASVARAAPDGYTILVHSSGFSAAQVLYKSLPYDTLNDFAAVIPLGVQPTVLVTSPSKGWKTVADLVAAAKAKPGAMNYATAGIGSISHLAAERFRLSAGIEAQNIPFKGPNEAFADVMTGRIDFYILPVAPALSLISDGKVVALAVGTARRAAALPNVPTVAEAGFKEAAFHYWNGLFVPAKTPRDIVNRLYQETQKALAAPSVLERLAKLGTDPLPMTTEEFDKYFRDDVATTAKLAKDAGIAQID